MSSPLECLRSEASGTPQRHVAGRLSGPLRWAVQDEAVPEPRAGEILIRLQGCGVCGSNLPVWLGNPWTEYPLAPGAPGHEGWGLVAACGPGVVDWKIGDRVAALSYRAFAQYDTAQAAHCIRLPDELADLEFPGEALGCAWNVFSRSRIESGMSVAVVGIGFLGALIVAIAARAGARVTAFGRRPFSLQMAEQYGAEQAYRVGTDDFCKPTFDCVVEAAGAADTLAHSSRLVRPRGTLVIAGYHQDGPRRINVQEWNWKGIDVVNAHERDPAVYMAGMLRAVDAVAARDIDLSPLLTHRFRLEEIGRAFQCARERPHGFMKALIQYE